LAAAGTIEVVGALYDVSTGVVEFLTENMAEPLPAKAERVAGTQLS
jgi:hypothetical protein